MENRDIYALEKQILGEFAPALKERSAFTEEAFQLIQSSYDLVHDKFTHEVSNRDHICVLLSARIANDLIATVRMAHIGYSDQANSVACSAWELTWIMCWIVGQTEAQAEKWFSHTETRHGLHANFKEAMRYVIKREQPSLSEDELKKKVELEQAPYTKMSMVRHANPQAMFVNRPAADVAEPMIGPSSDAQALEKAKYCMHHLLLRIPNALKAWYSLHAGEPEAASLEKRLNDMTKRYKAYLATVPGASRT